MGREGTEEHAVYEFLGKLESQPLRDADLEVHACTFTHAHGCAALRVLGSSFKGSLQKVGMPPKT